MDQAGLRRTWGALVLAAATMAGLGGCHHGGGGGPTGGVGADMAMASGSCDSPALAAGCTVGHCRLVLAPGAVTTGTHVQLSEKPRPQALADDAIGDVLCNVEIPPHSLTGALTLAISVDNPVDPSAVLFEVAEVGASVAVPGSKSTPNAVSGLISDSADYGVTLAPPAWTVDQVTGVDVSAAADQASFLRNLARNGFAGAAWDGAHLYVANGPRVLVWDGLPAGPQVRPARVLGQPSLSTTQHAASAATFDSPAAGVWSDGTRLAVATGNRVLIWSRPPTVDHQPADLVLGQSDFASDSVNQGGVSAGSLSDPQQIDSDGTRLMVADTLNNRVLVWDQFPLTIDQPATAVIGQPSFTSNDVAAGATPIYQGWGAFIASPTSAFVTGLYGQGLMHLSNWTSNNPPFDFRPVPVETVVERDAAYELTGLAHVPGGGLAARDVWGQRVVVWRTVPTGPMPIDVCLGQPDCSRQVSGPPTASTIAGASAGLGGGNGQLLVPDGNRLLLFDGAPAYHGQPATRVIGQAGFSTNEAVDYRGISPSTLAAPADVAVRGETVAVADRGNNRVLLYRRGDVGTAGAAAQVVLGQRDAASYLANFDTHSPSAATLSGPAGVALDGTHLIVADTENHRVLIWSALPTSNGLPADIVLGQSDGSGHLPNHGRGDGNGDGFSDADADGFFAPTGVASDGVHLYVADRLNHRVLVWSTFPTGNGQPADRVLGQPDFHANQPNHGQGFASAVPDGLDLPTGLTLDGTSLWIADTESNRVVRWDDVTGTPTQGGFLGQPDGATLANPNSSPPGTGTSGSATSNPTSATSVLRPRAVALAGGRVYVSESDSNRVHIFDGSSLAPLGQLGQASPTTADANVGGVSAAALWGPLGAASDGTRLYVADARNHRVLAWDVTKPPATQAAATALLGQPNFLVGGFDQASSAAGGVTQRPAGLARADKLLYVADSHHHRVLAFASPPQPGVAPVRVYGQPDGSLSLANSGGAPSARTLDDPSGVWADAQRLIVADTGNHRVLVYDATASGNDATLVLGQSSFGASAPNRGGAADLGTLQAPQGVYFDGTRLWVADTGNHRVLGWSSFPTQNGQAADLVLGQTDGAAIQPNRGGAPDATTLASPGAVLVDGNALFVGDTGNNRVLVFATLPTTSGAAASWVLGQPDFNARVPASDGGDLTRLAGASALASDGTWLYVADRDLGRVVAFALPVTASAVAAVAGYGSLQGDRGLALHGASGLAVERTADFTSRLYIGDTGDDRVVTVASVSRLRQP